MGQDVAVRGRETVVIFEAEAEAVSYCVVHICKGVLYKTTIKSDSSFI